jgi:hypothetical protein
MRRLSLTEISPGSAAAVIGLPTSYVESYGDWSMPGQTYGAEYEEGFARRYRGHHPPEKPISNLEKQTMAHYEVVKARWYDRRDLPAHLLTELQAANEGVVEALRDDDAVVGLFGVGGLTYRFCLDNGRADAGWTDRWDYTVKCLSWESQLESAQARRDNALSAVAAYSSTQGNTADAQAASGDAETARALGEQTATPGEQAAVVFDAEEGLRLPAWAKVAIGGVVALVVLRVLAPPLYGTWLARPARSPQLPLPLPEEVEI